MSTPRAHLTALVLVNWKGVFYERYLLDRNVTALEGANGAGKTTVMIAAYVVLLPDMSKLRFTTLGETGATGGDRGIWGRLGEPGRPSYSVLDLSLADGSRLLAGVKLARGAEPTVEPTPFIITGLPTSVRLADVLLRRELDGDLVPELDELVATVSAAGGTAQVFRTTREYFAALFEYGVTPMRLAADEERTKFNDLLRTSMTGGISRSLTSELRSFLLKEETGLGDALARMRGNLEACRRTRVEVAEARVLERDISAIYEAGLAMFSVAAKGCQSAAREGHAQVLAAERGLTHAEASLAQLSAELARQEENGLRQEQALLRARVARDDARRAAERRGAARMVARRLQTIDAELAECAEQLSAAKARQASRHERRVTARAERSRAREAYDRCAQGLASLQTGLDELARRAHSHRAMLAGLAAARSLLARPTLEPHDVDQATEALTMQREVAQQERRALSLQVRDLDERRHEYTAAVAALVALDPEASQSPATNYLARARTILATFVELDAAVARAPHLASELAELERQVARQLAARTLATALGLAVEVPGASTAAATALADVEEELRQFDEQVRVAEAAVAGLPPADSFTSQLLVLDERAARRRVATEAMSRLASVAAAPTTHVEIAALGRQLADRQVELTNRRAALGASRDQALAELANLSRGGRTVSPAILAVGDELGGDLLAAQLDDLDEPAATFAEARLGPRLDALIVDDSLAAASALTTLPDGIDELWLVEAGADLELEQPLAEGLVVTVERHGVRVSRRKATAQLGVLARERRLTQVEEFLATTARTLAATDEESLALASLRRDADALAAHADAYLAGDPAEVRAGLIQQLASRDAAYTGHQVAIATAHAQAEQRREKLAKLRRLLADASLLEGPPLQARATALAEEQRTIASRRKYLHDCSAPRAQLLERLEALRNVPPSDDELAAKHERLTHLEEILERGAQAYDALAEIRRHAHAASWSDAEGILATQSSLAPALQAQHVAARDAVTAADEEADLAEAALDQATVDAQTATATHEALLAHRARATLELAELNPTGGELDLTEVNPDDDPRVVAADNSVDELEEAVRALVSARALSVDRRARAGHAVADARTALVAATQAAGPTQAQWDELSAEAEAGGLLHSVLAAQSPVGAISSVLATAEAWSHRQVLVDRVTRTRGGEDLLAALQDLPLDGPGYLSAWQTTREWLRRRVPAQVAEVGDPLVALERLRGHLGLLESRLVRQETELRGASEDVARGIDVQVRRAHAQVRRLNQQLHGIAFGSITGIRVEIARIERMEQILRALREGQAQALLFTSSMPIEEALDEVFRRYGGGGRGGGAKLLDYREYVELVAHVQRAGSDTWETASPSRLSTGEAIGVGAALMMVVLTEWERDANLLRARRAGGSVRFLFLDEANRLSRDNLGVLFDLCRTLDLQLLIAAPEVARAEGNTTYRLIRHVSDDGREEVLVSGRRAATEAELAETHAASATP